MRIWIDILTPKQLLFSEEIVRGLGRGHEFLCTSRRYGEVTNLAKIRRFGLVSVGRHGGGSKAGKLRAGISRMGMLARKVESFSPDVAVSFCSPDAARVAFGLGTRHVSFCDAPHAEAQMRLVVPLAQKMLVPSVIPKSAVSRFGIREGDIMQYDAIDAALTIKRRAARPKVSPFGRGGALNIVIRPDESQAAYSSRPGRIGPIVRRVVADYGGHNIVILARYAEQARELGGVAGGKARVVKMSYDGKYILENSDVFVGSGGTMTWESALMGVPTISYNAVPNFIERHLVGRRLIMREETPAGVSRGIARAVRGGGKAYRDRAAKVRGGMEDPIKVLARALRG